MRNAVLFLPIITTAVGLAFAVSLFARYRTKGGMHLLWWAIGMLTYAAGTAVESAVTLVGWHAPLFRLWYIFGALLGGAPLAQGSVYLHVSRRIANRLTVALLGVIAFGATAVLTVPLDLSLVEPHRLTGKVIAWHWVRLVSPWVNLYAFTFLVGGAVRSAIRYAHIAGQRHRVTGNVLIAVGGLLPGIGGGFTRLGYTEVLYVTELIGLVLIYLGYRFATSEPAAAMSSPHSFPSHVALAD